MKKETKYVYCDCCGHREELTESGSLLNYICKCGCNVWWSKDEKRN